MKNKSLNNFGRSISIIIPAYNEEKRIEYSLKKIQKYFEKEKNKKKYTKYEIIVIDDCSIDKTFEIVSNYSEQSNNKIRILKNKINKGKGYSIKQGILDAKFDLVLFSDSDLATPIEELDKLFKYSDNYDVVIASRNMKESKRVVKQNLFRHLAGKIFSLFVNILLLPGIKDTQCGFKLFKTKAVKKIVKKQTMERWTFDVELLLIVKKMHYTIKEVPVVWIDKKGSKVNILRDSWRMFKDVIKIKINDLEGKYF